MTVAVMDVWEMRMLVHNGLVPVHMSVRFLSIPREVMDVLMMLIVAMSVIVFQPVVRVRVLMTLTQVQPDTQCH